MSETATPTPEASSGTQQDPSMAAVVITVDHVYLSIDEKGVGIADWAVTNVSTTKVSRDTEVTVPNDLALLLVANKQAVLV